MKISEITAADIWRHIRESPEDMETEDNTEILVMKKAAVEFCKGYTGLTEEQLDEHEDITIILHIRSSLERTLPIIVSMYLEM